ncbi:MAG: phosphate signaling complex protein PhoU [Planctomycetia bacterium]|nr:phosphate signaling complex protein PhoU [Planctomycetia bacterium]
MSSHFAHAVATLNDLLSRQEDLVLRCVDDAVHALVTADAGRAQNVTELDRKVDREEVRIEEECLKMIALYAPVARDLRYITTVLKVNNDLERIADHACNIARLTAALLQDRAFVLPPQAGEMSARVTEAISRGIRALRQQDIEEARRVLAADDAIDRLDSEIRQEVLRTMRQGPTHLSAALQLYRIGRELERIADLATNIAEDTIYLVTGEIVRHKRGPADPDARREGA